MLLLLYDNGCLLSQAFSSWHFTWISGDPHRTRFKLHTAVLSVLCVMFQVQLSCVVDLSNVFQVQFPNFSLSFSLLFQWLQLLLVQSYISGCTFVVSLYINSCILTSFPFPFAQHFCLRVLPHLSVCMFSLFFVFNYYIWPICCNFSVCVYCLITQHCDISLFTHRLYYYYYYYYYY